MHWTSIQNFPLYFISFSFLLIENFFFALFPTNPKMQSRPQKNQKDIEQHETGKENYSNCPVVDIIYGGEFFYEIFCEEFFCLISNVIKIFVLSWFFIILNLKAFFVIKNLQNNFKFNFFLPQKLLNFFSLAASQFFHLSRSHFTNII